jgi:hypothetical protein
MAAPIMNQATENIAASGGSSGWLQALLPLAATAGVAAIKRYVPGLPKAALPVLAPVLGALGEILGYYAGIASGNPMTGALLGATGVCLREAYDQTRKAMAPPSVQQ